LNEIDGGIQIASTTTHRNSISSGHRAGSRLPASPPHHSARSLDDRL